MTTKFIKSLKPTLADAFEVGRKEGLKEAFTEIQKLVTNEPLRNYIEARLKSIHDFENNNPFKQKESK